MASIKTKTTIHNAVTLTAGAANNTSSSVSLTTGYGAVVNIKLTNGATGPTVAAQSQVQISQDDSKWFDFGGALVGDTANSAVRSWSVDIPIGAQYVRTVSGSNTGQNVTIDVDVSNVTGI